MREERGVPYYFASGVTRKIFVFLTSYYYSEVFLSDIFSSRIQSKSHPDLILKGIYVLNINPPDIRPPSLSSATVGLLIYLG